ncbi:MAG: hypothetical protein ACKOEY_13760, partial [Phenylobacterium sp.]
PSPAPAPAPLVAEAVSPVSEPPLFEDGPSAGPGFLAPEQGDLLAPAAAAPLAAAASAEPEAGIRVQEPVIKKIVDPSVSSDDDFDGIFPNPIPVAPAQSRPTGFRLWGQKRPARYEPPPAAASPRAGGALPVETPGEAPAPEGENLDIPAFLRRLAN